MTPVLEGLFTESVRMRVFLMRLMTLGLALLGVSVPSGCASSGDRLEAMLPAGGMTRWEMRGVEEIVTFSLFDPSDPRAQALLPPGVAFVPASQLPMPFVQEHLASHPEHADWVCSVVEVARHEAFVIDGRSPQMGAHGAIGLWLAPVDPSGRAATDAVASAASAVLMLEVWVPDRAYGSYMRERGHHAAFGDARLIGDAGAGWRGSIRGEGLRIEARARPLGEAEADPEGGTQVLFGPGASGSTIVLAGRGGSHRMCEASWQVTGDHLLADAVWFGPTFETRYGARLVGCRVE